MSSDDEDSELIVIPFNAGVGEIINAKKLLVDAGVIDDNTHKVRRSSVLEKVESKIGKVVAGYDEGNNFIDDSEIINNSNESGDHELDPTAFKVVLSFGTEVTNVKPVEKSRTKSEEVVPEIPVPDEIEPYIEKIKQVSLNEKLSKIEKINSGSANEKDLIIKLTDEIVDSIGQCIDEKVRIETEKLKGATPSKSKIDKWKSDICKIIFQVCFTVKNAGKEYMFVKSTRVIQNAYKKYLDRKEPKPENEMFKEQNNEQDVDENAKELPIIPNANQQ